MQLITILSFSISILILHADSMLALPGGVLVAVLLHMDDCWQTALLRLSCSAISNTIADAQAEGLLPPTVAACVPRDFLTIAEAVAAVPDHSMVVVQGPLATQNRLLVVQDVELDRQVHICAGRTGPLQIEGYIVGTDLDQKLHGISFIQSNGNTSIFGKKTENTLNKVAEAVNKGHRVAAVRTAFESDHPHVIDPLWFNGGGDFTYRAVESGSLRMLEVVLAAGADPCGSSSSWPPMTCAVNNKRWDMVQVCAQLLLWLH